jgi:hypothetical protein
MQYRKLGKTGKMISALSFGCMRLPYSQQGDEWQPCEEKSIPMLRKAFEYGVNYFDTAYMYCNHKSQIILGKAMKTIKREDVMLATKQPLGMVHETSDFRKVLEDQLNSLDTPYIDFYHFHGLSRGAWDDKVKPLGLMKEAQKAIDEGLVKHMAFSYHGNSEDVKYLIDSCEMFASVLFHYNVFDRSLESAIDYLAEKGVGVVIMGPVAGGRLAAPSSLAERLLGDKNTNTAQLALRFVLGNPNVSSACSGMSSIEMLDQNIEVGNMKTPMTAEDFDKVKKLVVDLKKLSDLYCPACGYCQPCPQKINIPHIFDSFTFHNVYGMSEHGKGLYKQVLEGGKDWHGNLISEPITKCTECGECEKKCPQKIKIIEKLKEVDKIMTAL